MIAERIDFVRLSVSIDGAWNELDSFFVINIRF
jgi:hypothetical protein